MQRDRFAVARTWLCSSDEDVVAAKALLEVSPTRSAFHAQQAAELALKAATVAVSDDHQRTHSLRALMRELASLGESIPAPLQKDILGLEQFYMSTRYPDGVNDGDPSDFVDREAAHDALERALRIVTYASAIVDRLEAESARRH